MILWDSSITPHIQSIPDYSSLNDGAKIRKYGKVGNM